MFFMIYLDKRRFYPKILTLVFNFFIKRAPNPWARVKDTWSWSEQELNYSNRNISLHIVDSTAVYSTAACLFACVFAWHQRKNPIFISFVPHLSEGQMTAALKCNRQNVWMHTLLSKVTIPNANDNGHLAIHVTCFHALMLKW